MQRINSWNLLTVLILVLAVLWSAPAQAKNKGPVTVMSVQGSATDPSEEKALEMAQTYAITQALNVFLTAKEQTDNWDMLKGLMLTEGNPILPKVKIKRDTIKVENAEKKKVKQPRVTVSGNVDMNQLAENLATLYDKRAAGDPKVLLVISEPDKPFFEGDTIAEAIVTIRLVSLGVPMVNSQYSEGLNRWQTERLNNARKLSDDMITLIGRACWADAVVIGAVTHKETGQDTQWTSEALIDMHLLRCADNQSVTLNFSGKADNADSITAAQNAICAASCASWPEIASKLSTLLPEANIQTVAETNANEVKTQPQLALFELRDNTITTLGAEATALLLEQIVAAKRFNIVPLDRLSKISAVLKETRGNASITPQVIAEAGRCVGADLVLCGLASSTNKTKDLSLPLSSFGLPGGFSIGSSKTKSTTTLDLCMANCTDSKAIWGGKFSSSRSIKSTLITKEIGGWLPDASYGQTKGETSLESRVSQACLQTVQDALKKMNTDLRWTGKVLLIDNANIMISPTFGPDIQVGTELVIYRREGDKSYWDYIGCDQSCTKIGVAKITSVTPDAIEAAVDAGTDVQEGDFVEWQIPVQEAPKKK